MNQVLQEGTLYCQLESLNAESEHNEMRCVRLMGVQPHDFDIRQFEDGISAYTIDIQQNIFSRETSYEDEISIERCPIYEDCDICHRIFDEWFEVRFQSDSHGESFVYQCFGSEAPGQVSVQSVKRVAGFTLPSFPSSPLINLNQQLGWKCSSFEVGQGMSSIIYSDKDALLIDAGAGTPIKRPNYLNGTLTSYDLRSIVSSRNVNFFLSHGDADHWRMLGWDTALRNVISSFIVPAGMRQIAFFDKTVKSRVQQCASHIPTITLGPATSLNIYRTSPTRLTSNNDGLVAVFEKNGHRVLIAGDCVYDELLKDSDPVVNSLATNSYSAIVVPHHGDAASAGSVPRALAMPGYSPRAFFSAGNHSGYGHPNGASLRAHIAQGFTNLSQQNPSGISEVVLI